MLLELPCADVLCSPRDGSSNTPERHPGANQDRDYFVQRRRDNLKVERAMLQEMPQRRTSEVARDEQAADGLPSCPIVARWDGAQIDR